MAIAGLLVPEEKFRCRQVPAIGSQRGITEKSHTARFPLLLLSLWPSLGLGLWHISFGVAHVMGLSVPSLSVDCPTSLITG